MKATLAILWTILWIFLTEFFFMPIWSFSASSGMYWNIIIYSGIMAVILYKHDDGEFSPASKVFTVIAAISFVIQLCIGIFGSWALVHADEYRSLIGEIKQTEFTSNIQAIAPNQMLIVDKEIAQRIGSKELGSDPGLGSRAELGEFTLQPVDGKLYWIAPLIHSGFWKWNSFGDQGTPGYVRVSATNQEDYALVRTTQDGKDIHIVYQTGAYFGKDLERHIYTNGYRSKLYKEYQFEVDDNWNPYWTVTLYENKIGFNGGDAVGVLVVQPETGEIKSYSVKDAPAWVDRIQPADFVSDQVDDWGEYVHGYWNWSNRDVLRVAENSSLVLGADGHSYFYYGLTSSGNDQSTVGFVMVDTRSKQAHWFKQAGATEDAAKKSAEGKVQQMGYVGSDGITYNIEGYPTYEFLLKDKAGLMKQIALVNVHDHTIVGVGESRHEAMRDYHDQLTNRGNAVGASTSDMDKIKIRSVVSRFASEVVKGNTYYYFVLAKSPSKLFTSGSSLSDELPLTKEGDVVSISYIESSSGEISIMDFDNTNIGIVKDSIQIGNESSIDSVRTVKIETKSEKVVDSKWENLTPEEKKALMKKSK